jgi:hypothetical protein
VVRTTPEEEPSTCRSRPPHFIEGRDGRVHHPRPHAPKHQCIDPIKPNRGRHHFKYSLSVSIVERFAPLHIDHAQHAVDLALAVSDDALNKGHPVRSTHRHFEYRIRRGGAVYLEEAPCSGEGDGVCPGMQDEHRATKLLDGTLESGAPPMKVQISRSVLIVRKKVKPHHNIWRMAEMVLHGFNHI